MSPFDIGRLLSKAAHELRSTDIPGDVLAVLTQSRVRDVVIIGRRGPAQAKFTTKELRELGELANADVIVPPAELQVDEAGEAVLKENPAARPQSRHPARLVTANTGGQAPAAAPAIPAPPGRRIGTDGGHRARACPRTPGR
jgi:hypothetical protein